MDTLELCGDILQPGGQLETPGLVIIDIIATYLILLARSFNLIPIVLITGANRVNQNRFKY